MFTKTEVTQTMKTNQMTELKQKIPTFSNPANQMSYFQIQPMQRPIQNNENPQLVPRDTFSWPQHRTHSGSELSVLSWNAHFLTFVGIKPQLPIIVSRFQSGKVPMLFLDIVLIMRLPKLQGLSCRNDKCE